MKKIYQAVLNMNKFNGKYGCIMWKQQGENLISTGRGFNLKYTFKPSEMFPRTEGIEGMLGYWGSLIHLTRGFDNQIGKHLTIENYLNFEGNDEYSKMNTTYNNDHYAIKSET